MPLKEWDRKEILEDFVFSDNEKEELINKLTFIKTNPYTSYYQFTSDIYKLLSSGKVPSRFIEFMFYIKNRDYIINPYVFIRNCPIDRKLPKLDYSDPVVSKRNLKKTFVAEGFLYLYSILASCPPIGYIDVNDGDVFQDIAPWKSLESSQSQKALKRIYFHKDLANHFVRPDFVNILALRNWEGNDVYTSFSRNIDIITSLGKNIIVILRENRFYTPFDDLTTNSKNLALGEADMHPVISGDYDLRYFETRTVGKDEEAQEAIKILNDTIHKYKIRLKFKEGDFLSSQNNNCIHAKEVVNVVDEEKLKERWLMKTVNIYQHYKYEHHYMKDRYGIVLG